jgi:hypothetical protein
MEATLNGPSGRTVLGPAEITVGRLSSNQVMVNDPKASSRHATIRQASQSYNITDLGSTNGTFVNEQKLSPNTAYTLNPGDRIRIGDTTFTYEVTGAPAIAPTVYGGAAQGQGYDPTVAAASPYKYEASPPPAYQPPPDYQVSPAQQAYNAPPAPYSPYGSPGQPAYGAPVPAVPGVGTTPARRGNRTLWIILSIVGGVLVLGIISCVVLVSVLASTPTKTLQSYCDGLRNGDYQTAYNQLSNTIQGQVSESQFADSNRQAANAVSGISSCTVNNVNQTGSSATGQITFNTGTGKSVTDNYNLINDNGAWKIGGTRTTSIPNKTLQTHSDN